MENAAKSINSVHEVPKAESTPHLTAGILTGQIAGLIMAVVVMAVFTIFLGKGPLFPVQVIGSTLLGESALQGLNITAVLVGLVLHQFGPSLLWGSLYGYLAPRFEATAVNRALGLGLFMGVVSMVGPYLLIPLVMKTLHGVDFWNQEVPMFWDWAAHIVFGLSFAVYPAVYRWVSSATMSNRV